MAAEKLGESTRSSSKLCFPTGLLQTARWDSVTADTAPMDNVEPQSNIGSKFRVGLKRREHHDRRTPLGKKS
ncbi:hypothetical protein D3C71_1869230 [compost metagenome]